MNSYLHNFMRMFVCLLQGSGSLFLAVVHILSHGEALNHKQSQQPTKLVEQFSIFYRLLTLMLCFTFYVILKRCIKIIIFSVFLAFSSLGSALETTGPFGSCYICILGNLAYALQVENVQAYLDCPHDMRNYFTPLCTLSCRLNFCV